VRVSAAMAARLWRRSLLLAALPLAAGVTFEVAKNEQRCVSEMMPEKGLLTGDWSSVPAAANISTSGGSGGSVMRVLGPDTVTLFESTEVRGHFAVTAKENGLHSLCMTNGDESARETTLHIKTALEVEDHSLIAKKEHVEAIEAELDRMEKMAEHVYDEMNHMRSRSEMMQATDASTRGRLLWVEIAMLCTLLLMGMWQIAYLKRYFQTKKIL